MDCHQRVPTEPWNSAWTRTHREPESESIRSGWMAGCYSVFGTAAHSSAWIGFRRRNLVYREVGFSAEGLCLPSAEPSEYTRPVRSHWTIAGDRFRSFPLVISYFRLRSPWPFLHCNARDLWTLLSSLA